MSDEQDIGSDGQKIGGLVESQWENIYYSLDSWETDETGEDRELRRAAYFAQVEQARQLCRIEDVLTAMLAGR